MSDFKVSGSRSSQQTKMRSKVNTSLESKATTRANNTQAKVNFGDADKIKDVLFATFPQLALPQIDQKMLIDILRKLEVDLFQSQLLGENEVILTEKDQIENLNKINQKNSIEMLKKIEKKNHSALVGKIFGWIGAALGIILGGILAVVTLGAGSGIAAALITASLALAVALVIMSASGGMEKMTAALAKSIAKMLENFGVDSKKARRISQIMAQVIIGVIIIAIQIILAIASGGSSVANFVSETVNKIASIAMKIANFSLATVAVAGAAANTASGAYNYEAIKDSADNEENKAILKKIQALIESEQDMIEEILQHLLSSQENMGQLIKDENQNRGTLADIDASSAAV